MNTFWRFIFSGIFFLTAYCAQADEIPVAVASNFTAPLEAIALAFTQSTGHTLRISSGSSGKFYAQIRHGAPFQVFLSADQDKPQQLETEGLAVPGTRYTYAIGKLILWSADPALVDQSGKVLFSNQFNKLAIANPKLAPYGVAAIETLQALKLRQSLEPRWVMGENITQTYQFVASGNAALGFVALSQVMQNHRLSAGSGWVVPAQLYTPILQDAVLLRPGEHNPAARQFLAFLRSPTAVNIIREYGYDTH